MNAKNAAVGRKAAQNEKENMDNGNGTRGRLCDECIGGGDDRSDDRNSHGSSGRGCSCNSHWLFKGTDVSMGLVSLMQKAKAGETKEAYDFTMVTAADELLGKVMSGDLDIALVPANVASVLYNKTEGGVQAIDMNTLGVLYAGGEWRPGTVYCS